MSLDVSSAVIQTTAGLFNDILFADVMKCPKPSQVAQPPYHGIFGMCEMESAADVIMKTCLTDDSWVHHFSLSDFMVHPYVCCYRLDEHKHGLERSLPNPEYRGDRMDTLASDGFLQLLSRGWMVHSYPNSVFRVHPDFIKRLAEHVR